MQGESNVPERERLCIFDEAPLESAGAFFVAAAILAVGLNVAACAGEGIKKKEYQQTARGKD